MNRKELTSKYKQTVRPMGILQIRNLINGKTFVCAAPDLQGRINRYKFQLELGSHPNKELQREFSEFGEAAFVYEVLDHLDPKDDLDYDYTDDLKQLEQLWLEKLQPFAPVGYNKK